MAVIVPLCFTQRKHDGKTYEIYMPSLLKPVYLNLKDCRTNPHQPETINIFSYTQAYKILNAERHLVCFDIFKAASTSFSPCLSNKSYLLFMSFLQSQWLQVFLVPPDYSISHSTSSTIKHLNETALHPSDSSNFPTLV